MNLQPKRDTVSVQKEFLNTTQGMINKVGGATLGEGFTGDYVLAGSAITVGADGLAVPFTDGAEGTSFVTAHDVKNEEGAIVGALESAFLKESVVTATESGRVKVTQAFIDATDNRFHLR